VDEDESASDWDDLSSKDSVRLSITPTSATHQPLHSTQTAGRKLAVGDAALQEHSSVRTKLENNSNGIQSQPQIAVELSRIPALDQLSKTSQSSPHPVFTLTSPVAGKTVRSPLNVEVSSDMDPTPAQTFLHPNSPKTTFKSPGKHVKGSEVATRSSNGPKSNSPVLSLNRSHDLPHSVPNKSSPLPAVSRSHDPPIPTFSRSHDQPLSVKSIESPRNFGTRPHDQRAVYEVHQGHGNRRSQGDQVGHVAKLEEAVGEEDESNAFGIPEEINMTASEDLLPKKPARCVCVS